MPMTTK